MMATSAPKAAPEHRSERKFADNIAATANHAVSCMVNDSLFAPRLDRWFQQRGIQVQTGCGHPGHLPVTQRNAPLPTGDPSRACGPFMTKGFQEAAAKLTSVPIGPARPPKILSTGQFYLAEYGADIAAVPMALAVQRYAPGVTTGIRAVIEPVLGPIFAASSRRSARNWGKEYGYLPGDAAVKDYRQHLYDREMGQVIPTGLLWGTSALGLNTAFQRALGSEVALGSIAWANLRGALISSSIVFAARAISPAGMQRFDAFNGRHIVSPVSQTIGRLFGVDKKTLDSALAQEASGQSPWQDRLDKAAAARDAAAPAR